MPITFKGKNISEIYKSGSKTIIPNGLTTERAPSNEFEKNFPNGIIINGKDINEQANSPYTDCDKTTSVTCTGYKHFSAFGRGGRGGSGGTGGDNKGCAWGKGNGGSGGSGGLGGTFGLLKYPLNGANTINITMGSTGNSGNKGNSGDTCKKYGDGNKGGSGNQTLISVSGTDIISGLGGEGGSGGNGATSKDDGNRGGSGITGSTWCRDSNYDAKSKAPISSDDSHVRIYFHYQ
jgi:hypothetical protein